MFFCLVATILPQGEPSCGWVFCFYGLHFALDFDILKVFKLLGKGRSLRQDYEPEAPRNCGRKITTLIE